MSKKVIKLQIKFSFFWEKPTALTRTLCIISGSDDTVTVLIPLWVLDIKRS